MISTLDLMFRHHICSSCLADTSRGSKEIGGKGNFKIICLGIVPVTLKVGNTTFDLHKIDWPM